MPADEWDAISLNYTSGTTGNPKGVVYHHRGAYLNACRQHRHLEHAAAPGLPVDAADVPLQRLVLPLDDGAANAGTSVCLRRSIRR
jgi:fatty-acyl-CoA synthase